MTEQANETPVNDIIRGVAEMLQKPLAHLRIEGDMASMSIGTRKVLDEIAARLVRRHAQQTPTGWVWHAGRFRGFAFNSTEAKDMEEGGATLTAVYAAPPAPHAALRHAFRAADKQDWDHLFRFIPDSGHGRFWKAVFAEVRAALQTEAPAPGCSDLNCKDPNCTYDSEPAPEYRCPGDNKTKSERATPTEGDPVLSGQNSREELHKQYAKDWQRQIISAGGDENVALQAVTLAALNGLFDHLSTSNSPGGSGAAPGEAEGGR